MENDALPYQRRKILLRLHVCQLKRRTDLWYRNTSFFSIKEKKKSILGDLCVLKKKSFALLQLVLLNCCFKNDAKSCFRDQGHAYMHWCIA